MMQNVEQVLVRGERLDVLVNQTDDLRDQVGVRGRGVTRTSSWKGGRQPHCSLANRGCWCWHGTAHAVDGRVTVMAAGRRGQWLNQAYC